jgi:hypothetical protein
MVFFIFVRSDSDMILENINIIHSNKLFKDNNAIVNFYILICTPTIVFYYCSGLIECPIILSPFRIIQQGHF